MSWIVRFLPLAVTSTGILRAVVHNSLPSGKAATSRSRFKGFVAKAWTKLFVMPQKSYIKQMSRILDRLDRIAGQETVIRTKRARLARRPNAAKEAALDKEEAKLEEQKAKVEEDEENIKKLCKLRPKYAKPPKAEK